MSKVSLFIFLTDLPLFFTYNLKCIQPQSFAFYGHKKPAQEDLISSAGFYIIPRSFATFIAIFLLLTFSLL